MHQQNVKIMTQFIYLFIFLDELSL